MKTMERNKGVGPDIDTLKKMVFNEMLNLAGRVFILVKYSKDVVIGKRGFLPDEQEKGLVLVINNKMNFRWEDNMLCVKLVFGTTPEECCIPAGAVLSVFSPELAAQFAVSPDGKKSDAASPAIIKPGKGKTGTKVVKVDFSKKK